MSDDEENDSGATVGEAINAALEEESTHSVDEEDAVASQFYVAEVVESTEAQNAAEGDRELILTNEHLSEGQQYTAGSYGSGTKKYEVLGGPYDCPPLPHVLALKAWVDEKNLGSKIGLESEGPARGDGSEMPDDNDLPEWVPEEYDPEAPIEERLPILPEIEGGIEVWAADDLGLKKVLGEPHEVRENHAGTLTMYIGGQKHNWNYEVVVPVNDTAPYVREVNPDQPMEDYQRTKKTVLTDADVRIYGVDVDRLDGVESEVPA